MELFPDQVFCFTPRGDLIQLPRGSTPLDFAYAVHTSIGTRCRYARVNGRLQSIHAELRTGDLVEIVCEPGAEPAAEWEEKVVSGKARAEIRRFHNAKRRRELLGRGRLLLGRALDALSGGMLAIRDADADGDGDADGGASYPRGGAAVTASAATAPAAGPAVEEQEEVEVLDFSPTKDAQMAMHLSRCCRPLPGDDVIGLVPRDGPAAALVVHRASCPACQPKPNERRVAVRWGEPWRRAEHRATARLSLQLLDPRLGFAQVAAALAELDGTISSFRISRRVEGVAFATLEVEVRDLAHLDEALAALGALAGVRNVRRA